MLHAASSRPRSPPFSLTFTLTNTLRIAAELPESMLKSFDVVVIDPPFITEEVWRKYAATAYALLKDGKDGKAVCTTVFENAPLMAELFNCKPQAFLPSIPHLVYQYNSYANFENASLSAKNPEIPED